MDDEQARSAVRPNRPAPRPDDWHALRSRLVDEEFEIGTREILDAMRVMDALSGTEAGDRPLGDLGTLVGPIFCRTPREQARFKRVFADWAKEVGSRVEDPDKRPPEVEPAYVEQLRKLRRRSWRIRVALIVGGTLTAVLIVAVLGWLVIPPGPSSVGPGPAPDPPFLDDPPTPDPSIDAPAPVGVPAAGPQPDGGGTGRASPRGRALPITLLVLIGVWFAYRLLYHLWWQRQAARFLGRGAVDEDAPIRRLRFRKGDQLLFARPLFTEAAQRLRARREVVSDEIDAPATVIATVRSGDRFEPVHRMRKMTPEYLALIDSRSLRDQRGRYADLFLDRLVTEGIAIDRRYFRHHPALFTAGPGEGWERLRDLTGRFPEHRVWLFCDADQLLDPLRGTIQPGLEELDLWTDVTLFVDRPPGEWGGAEHLLVEAGWTVLPATTEGLAAASASHDDALESLYLSGAGLPTGVADRWGDWTGPDPLTEEETRAGLAATERFLGRSGFVWLCACAVFPELNWAVTNLLGRRLRDEDGEPVLTEERLSAMSRLPWFRIGYMPDWVRRELVGRLDADVEATVREILHAMLSARTEDADGFELEIATGERRTERRLWGGAARHSRHHGASGLLQDRLVLDVLDDSLAVRIPRQLGRLLRPPKGVEPWREAWPWPPRPLFLTLPVVALLFAAVAFVLPFVSLHLFESDLPGLALTDLSIAGLGGLIWLSHTTGDERVPRYRRWFELFVASAAATSWIVFALAYDRIWDFSWKYLPPEPPLEDLRGSLFVVLILSPVAVWCGVLAAGLSEWALRRLGRLGLVPAIAANVLLPYPTWPRAKAFVRWLRPGAKLRIPQFVVAVALAAACAIGVLSLASAVLIPGYNAYRDRQEPHEPPTETGVPSAVAPTKPRAEGVDVGDRASAIALRDLDGALFRLSDVIGPGATRPAPAIIVNFFATWCGPCLDQMPDLAGVHERFAGRGVQLVLIDVGEGVETVASWRSEAPKRAAIILDPDKIAFDRYSAKGAMPSTLVIDSSGRIAFRVDGSSKALAADLDEVLSTLVQSAD